jgi:hypothetical protein
LDPTWVTRLTVPWVATMRSRSPSGASRPESAADEEAVALLDAADRSAWPSIHQRSVHGLVVARPIVDTQMSLDDN